jgi:hypothetical protein
MIENLPFVAVQILLLVGSSIAGSGSGFFYMDARGNGDVPAPVELEN